MPACGLWEFLREGKRKGQMYHVIKLTSGGKGREQRVDHVIRTRWRHGLRTFFFPFCFCASFHDGAARCKLRRACLRVFAFALGSLHPRNLSPFAACLAFARVCVCVCVPVSFMYRWSRNGGLLVDGVRFGQFATMTDTRIGLPTL